MSHIGYMFGEDWTQSQMDHVSALKWLRASVSVCLFQIQPAILQMDELYPQLMSACHLDWSEGKAGGHKGW